MITPAFDICDANQATRKFVLTYWPNPKIAGADLKNFYLRIDADRKLNAAQATGASNGTTADGAAANRPASTNGQSNGS